MNSTEAEFGAAPATYERAVRLAIWHAAAQCDERVSPAVRRQVFSLFREEVARLGLTRSFKTARGVEVPFDGPEPGLNDALRFANGG